MEPPFPRSMMKSLWSTQVAPDIVQIRSKRLIYHAGWLYDEGKEDCKGAQ